ncbi:hypothetical protein [Serratia sp. NFX21]|uniref:hypothetical protein n=1 Tax=Serratia sp. NFX21 TaxID=3402279 RepID=UPI003AF390F7
MNEEDNYLERRKYMSESDRRAEQLSRYVRNKTRAKKGEEQIPYPDIPYFTHENIENDLSDDNPWWIFCKERGYWDNDQE